MTIYRSKYHKLVHEYKYKHKLSRIEELLILDFVDYIVLSNNKKEDSLSEWGERNDLWGN